MSKEEKGLELLNEKGLEGIQYLKRIIDLGCLAIIFNVIVFIIVSKITKKVEPSHIESFKRDLN